MTLVFFGAAISLQAESKNLHLISPEKTGKWEKLELGVDLPADIAQQVTAFTEGETGLNPFDPDQVSVEAIMELQGSSGTQRKIFGFYYEDFSRQQENGNWKWSRQGAKFPFRIRFAPNQVGNWVCTVKLVTNKTNVVELGKINFTCVESSSKGQVQLTHTNDARNRYLQFSDTKNMFFAVGMNLVWSHLDEMKVGDYAIYSKWMDQLVKAKANYIQLSSLPFSYGIEQEKLNNYSMRMPQAWEFDQLLELAERGGIYINLLTLIHDEFGTGQGWIHKNNHWTNNPYNTIKNGGQTNAKNPQDFFSDEACKGNFKKRLRYLLSRFGYSNNLAVIELLSEVDNAIPGYKEKSAMAEELQKVFKQWFTEMKAYIQEELGYGNKLVSVSFTQNDQADDIDNGVFPLSDVILLHFYGRDKYTNFKNRYLENVKPFATNLLTQFKPVIFDEMGANVFPSLDKYSDITFHNNLWATAFMGCFGSGQTWWWDNAILPNGYENNLKGMVKFLEDENYTATGFTGEVMADNGKKFKSKTVFETYFLKSSDGNKVTGWLHNTSFYWANLKNDNSCIAKLIEDNNGSSVDKADNTQYKKEYDKGKATGAPQSKNGTQLKLVLNPSTAYIIKWYNTVTGEPTGETQTANASSSGKIKFNIPDINYPQNKYGDLGYKIVKFSR